MPNYFSALFLILLFAPSSYATIVTYRASGYIETGYGTAFTDGYFQSNDLFEITWSWDTSAIGIGSSDSSEHDLYEAITFSQVNLADYGPYTSEAAGIINTNTAGSVDIINNHYLGPDYYSFGSSYTDNNQSIFFGNNKLLYVTTTLYDDTQENIQNTLLPTNLDSTDFSSKIFSATFYDSTTRTYSHIDGIITDLIPVPIPSAIWLFSSGIICLFGFVNLKRSRSPN